MQRGRTPVVVGGTGFYLRVMQEGKPQGSRATPEVADAVKQEVHKVRGGAGLHVRAQGAQRRAGRTKTPHAACGMRHAACCMRHGA